MDMYFGKIENNVHIIPFMALHMFYNSDFTSFSNIEAESSYRYSPITRANSKGGQRFLGYRVEIKTYVPHTVYIDETTYGESMLTRLNTLTQNRHDVQLLLGKRVVALPAEHRGETVNATEGLWLEFHRLLRMTYEIESVPFKPRLIITHTGIVPKINMV